MRSIKVKKWKSPGPDSKEIEETTISLIHVLLMSGDPKDMPKGLDKFRLFNRIAKACDTADKSGTLVFEEADFLFIEKCIKDGVPAVWGTNKAISEAVEEFLATKPKEIKG